MTESEFISEVRDLAMDYVTSQSKSLAKELDIICSLGETQEEQIQLAVTLAITRSVKATAELMAVLLCTSGLIDVSKVQPSHVADLRSRFRVIDGGLKE